MGWGLQHQGAGVEKLVPSLAAQQKRAFLVRIVFPVSCDMAEKPK